MQGAISHRGDHLTQFFDAVSTFTDGSNTSLIFFDTVESYYEQEGLKSIHCRVVTNTKNMLSPLFNASRLSAYNGEDRTFDTPFRAIPASAVIMGKTSEGRSVELILNDPNVVSVQERHPILKTDWFSNQITNADLSRKISQLMSFCIEHYGEDMEPNTKALFSITEPYGEYSRYLLRYVNDASIAIALKTHLTHFCQFLSLLSLVEDRSQKKDMFALFPPLEPEEYQCMAGTDERLRNGAKRVLDQRLLGRSGESNLLEHLNHAIIERFNRYVQDIIIEEGILASTHSHYHIHVVPCLRYILGLNNDMVADPFYRMPIPYIKSETAFRILNGFEGDMNRALSDVTATFDEHITVLNDNLHRWVQSGLASDLEAIEECELIKLAREVDQQFSVTDFSEWNDESMKIDLNYVQFESELFNCLKRYARPVEPRTLRYKDAFSNPDKVVKYLVSYDPEKVSQEVDLLFSIAEAFRYSSPIDTLTIIFKAGDALKSIATDPNPIMRANIQLKAGGMSHQLDKLQRISDRVEAFISLPQAKSQGGSTKRGLTEYFKRANTPNAPCDDSALFKELVDNFAPFSLFQTLLPSDWLSKDHKIPKAVFRHPQAEEIISFILSHKHSKDVRKLFNDKHFTFAHDLIEKGELGLLKVFSEFGLNLNEFDAQGRTPAKLAVDRGDLAALKILVLNDAALDFYNMGILTNIACHAARHNLEDVLVLLLENGCSLGQADGNGKTPSYHAAEHGNLGCLKKLVEKNYQRSQVDLGRVDKNNIAPILIAAKNGHRSVVEFLAQCGELDRYDDSGHTPIFWAVKLGLVGAIDLLAKSGASLDWMSSDDAHESWLRVFNQRNAVNLIGVLAKHGANLNKADILGQRPLHIALQSNKPEAICTAFYNNGASIYFDEFHTNPILIYLNKLENILIDMIKQNKKEGRDSIDQIHPIPSPFEKTLMVKRLRGAPSLCANIPATADKKRSMELPTDRSKLISQLGLDEWEGCTPMIANLPSL